MEIRKIFWNGSTLLMSIPAEYAKVAQLRSGTFVNVELNEDNSLKVSKLAEQSGEIVKRQHLKSTRKRSK